MTGRWVDATEALALGLVNRVEPDPLPVAEQLAAALAAGSAAALARIKMIMTSTACSAGCTRRRKPTAQPGRKPSPPTPPPRRSAPPPRRSAPPPRHRDPPPRHRDPPPRHRDPPPRHRRDPPPAERRTSPMNVNLVFIERHRLHIHGRRWADGRAPSGL